MINTSWHHQKGQCFWVAMWSNLALTYITVPTCKIGKNTIWTEFVGHWLQQFNTHVFPYEGLLSHFTNLKQFFRNIYWIIAELDHLAQPDWEHKLPFRDSRSILPVKETGEGVIVLRCYMLCCLAKTFIWLRVCVRTVLWGTIAQWYYMFGKKSLLQTGT